MAPNESHSSLLLVTALNLLISVAGHEYFNVLYISQQNISNIISCPWMWLCISLPSCLLKGKKEDSI